MPLMPVFVGGKVRLVQMAAGAGAKDLARAEEENVRRAGVYKRRLYYGGEQYDEENAETAIANQIDLLTGRLPEHMRLHAYSTHIQESVDFVADQMSESFSVAASDSRVQVLIDTAMEQSDRLADGLEDLLRDGLIAGDVAVFVRWDPVLATAYYEFWESEFVEFRYVRRGQLEKVIRSEVVWVYDPNVSGDKQVVERREYVMRVNDIGEMECREEVFWDDDDVLVMSSWLGVPFIPWVLIRADAKQLRGTRGESLITDQVMETADRFNAVEQVAWLIARYNSHGNLAVVGDAAQIQAKQDDCIAKDVADVLTFPGGTSVTTITLPTDPQMIEHQRQVLADAMYTAFGLTRVDTTTIQGLGGISGYALEILNRKTEGTFRRIRRNVSHDLQMLFDMTLDATAYLTNEVLTAADGTVVADLADVPIDMPVGRSFMTVDPAAEFPNREIEIRLGSGYIVDDVLVRDDFNSKLISRREALRQRGYSDEDIARIEEEIAEDAPALPEVGMFSANGTQAGATVGTATRP